MIVLGNKLPCTVVSLITSEVGIGKHLTQLWAQDRPGLEKEDVRHEDKDGKHDEKGLNIKLHKSTPGLPVEGAPCLNETNAAGTAQNCWDNLAAKSAVEGHDGLFLFWKERGLDSGERHGGGKNDEETGEKGNREQANYAESERDPLHASVSREFVGINVVEVEDPGVAHGDVHGSVSSGCLDSSGNPELAQGGCRRDALVETLGGRE